jgi:gamma-glutamylaminecyclotransferase
MQLLFVYGSLKQGFANEHVNTGRRVAGRFRTREAFVLCLHGTGEVPCLLSPAGEGHQVFGELYEVTPDDLARMDRLERVGDADGYERVDITIERVDGPGPTVCQAQAYLKRAALVPASDRRTEALCEYLPEHAARFHWVGRSA